MRSITAADLLRSSPLKSAAPNRESPALRALLGSDTKLLPSHSVLDVRGPSGCGKSLLAIQIVAEELVRSCDLRRLAADLDGRVRRLGAREVADKRELAAAVPVGSKLHGVALGPFDICPSCGSSSGSGGSGSDLGGSGLLITSLSAIRLSASLCVASRGERPLWAGLEAAQARAHARRLRPPPLGVLYMDFDCKVDVARLLKPVLRVHLMHSIAESKLDVVPRHGAESADDLRGDPAVAGTAAASDCAAPRSEAVADAMAEDSPSASDVSARAEALLASAVADCLSRLLLVRPSSIAQAGAWIRAAAALSPRHAKHQRYATTSADDSGAGASTATSASVAGSAAASASASADLPPWPVGLASLSLSLVVLDGSRSMALEEVSLALGGSTRSYRDVARAIEDRARTLVPPVDAALAAALTPHAAIATASWGAGGASASASSSAFSSAPSSSSSSPAMAAWCASAMSELFTAHTGCSAISINRPLPTEATPQWQQARHADASEELEYAGEPAAAASGPQAGPLSRLLAEAAAGGGLTPFRWRLLPRMASLPSASDSLLPPAPLSLHAASMQVLTRFPAAAHLHIPTIWSTAHNSSAEGSGADRKAIRSTGDEFDRDAPLLASVLLQQVGVVSVPDEIASAAAASSHAAAASCKSTLQRDKQPLSEAAVMIAQVTRYVGATRLPGTVAAAPTWPAWPPDVHWLLCAVT